MRTTAQILAGFGILTALWWVTDSEHHVGFLIGLLVAGALAIFGARCGETGRDADGRRSSLRGPKRRPDGRGDQR